MILSAVIFIFLFMELVYLFLLFKKPVTLPFEKSFQNLTVLVPAYNEEENIRDCLNSIISADFNGGKEIIVINDGSTDNTLHILKEFDNKITILNKSRGGKADSLNAGLKVAKGGLIAVVDGDSIVPKNAFNVLKAELELKGVAAVSGIIKVKNRKRFLGMWLHVEQLYNSLLRYLLSKVNANIVTPGPLSMYRKDALLEVGGFSVRGFSEDVDISVRLIRQGYSVLVSQEAYAETVMPYTISGFIIQRFRFVRGTIDIFKKHLRFGKNLVDIYTLPMFLFIYVQAIVTGLNNLYQIFSGYLHYFVLNGVIFNGEVLKFFFEWLSLYGFLKWSLGVFSGTFPFTITSVASILATVISYILMFVSVIRYDSKFNIYHLVPIFFMFPFWLVVSLINILSFPEFFIAGQKNIWEKKF